VATLLETGGYDLETRHTESSENSTRRSGVSRFLKTRATEGKKADTGGQSEALLEPIARKSETTRFILMAERKGAVFSGGRVDAPSKGTKERLIGRIHVGLVGKYSRDGEWAQ